MSPDVPGSGAAGGHANPERDRQAQAGPSPEPQPRQGVRIHIIVVAAIASGTAAVITSLFWKGGTIISAAIFATLVAFLRETLQRPASRIADASKAKLADTLTPPKPKAPSWWQGVRDRLADWLSPSPTERPAQATPYTRVYGTRRVNPRTLLVTAALAFLIAVLALTVAELAFGGAAASNQSTTLFGGGSTAVRHPSPAPTQTTPTITETAPRTGSSQQTTQTGKSTQSTPSTQTTPRAVPSTPQPGSSP